MKTKKYIFNIIVIMISILIMVIPNFIFAEIMSQKIEVKLVEGRNDGMCYSIGDASILSTDKSHKLWNILQVKENDAYEAKSIYCMDAQRNGYNFGSNNQESDNVSYNKKYDFDADRTNIIQKIFNNNDQTLVDNYNKILALLDILYIPESDNSAAYKQELLKNAGIEENNISDDSIKAIQQAAIWYFTNNNNELYSKPYEITKNSEYATWLYVKANLDSKYQTLTDYYGEENGVLAEENFGKLYTYLIDTAQSNANKYNSLSQVVTPVEIVGTEAKIEENGEYYIYGPFNITKDNNYNYNLSLKVNEGDNYKLLNENKVESEDKSLNNFKENKFYIKIESKNVDNIKVSVTGGYNKTSAALYTKDAQEAILQPIVLVERKKQPIQFEFLVNRPKKFDLALRKYITKVNGKDLEEARIPDIDTKTLETGTTATYKHRKDPVRVDKGDTVVYELSVYNEGEKNGRATEIVDQLPSGLVSNLKTGSKVTSIKGNEYVINYDENTNKLILTTEGTNNLNAYNGQNLDSDSIQIECTVTEEENEKEKVLTNVAYISKEFDSEDEVTITNQPRADRDSEPATTPKADAEGTQEVTKDNVENYKGKTTNSDELYHSDYYYEGWQDDDDFEKLVLNPIGKYNLKLTKVNVDSAILTNSATFNINGQELTTQNGIIEIAKDVSIKKSNLETPDKYEITEVVAPDGYEIFKGKVILNIYKKYEYDQYLIDTEKTMENLVVQDENGKDIPEEERPIVLDFNENNINLELINFKKTGYYEISMKKVDENGNPIIGKKVEFSVQNGENVNTMATEEGNVFLVASSITTENIDTPDEYTITETIAPEGYDKFNGKVILKVYKKKENEKYVIDKEQTKNNLKILDENNNEITQNSPISIDITDNFSIILTLKNNIIRKGEYSVELVKEDENGENLTDPATFEVTNKQTGNIETKTTKDSKLDITNGTVQITEENVNTPDIYEIIETKAPDKYCEFDGKIILTVNKIQQENNYVVKDYQYDVVDENGISIKEKVGDAVKVHLNDKGNIYVEVKNYQFDLALRKFISKVNDKEYDRAPEVDTEELNKKHDNGEIVTTAKYIHSKEPVEVSKGDIVIYTLRVFNEGDIDGYASEIKDYLPPYLEFVKGDFNTQYKWTVSEDGRTVISTYLEDQLIEKVKNENGKLKLSYKDLPIMCKVKDTLNYNEVITNIAEITKCEDKNKKEVTDRDSTPDNVEVPKDEELPKYKENEKTPYVPGQQDDDDFEKVIVKPFDLKLIKRITEVNGKEQTQRIKNIDVSKLNTKDENGNEITTADYKLEKNPVQVQKGDIVTYTLRVYNEGYIDGYAKEITENIPEGLEFIIADNNAQLTKEEQETIEYNNERGWVITKADPSNTSRVIEVKTNALDRQIGIEEENLIKAFGKNDGNKTEKDLAYKEVSIKLKVIADNEKGQIIRNEACISQDADKDGKDVTDRDSTPEEWKKENSDKYNDNDKKWPIYKEDDEDYDNIELKMFDLSLRKFITQIDDKKHYREPQVDTSKLNTKDENGQIITTAIYNHDKTPIEVNKGSTIIYTLRVYNEGETDGYASEIKDYLPTYLEFVDGDFNKQYKWTLSQDGRTVSSTYLEDQLIEKVKDENGKLKLSYKDIQIMCKVKDIAKTNEVITNLSEITKCKDKDKNDVTDRDSTPSNINLPPDSELPSYKQNEQGSYIPGQEDDDDFEKVIVRKFDLALRKWVTQAIAIENGKQTVTNTNHDAWDEPEGIVKVELNRKKLNEITVKFKYSIRVYNQGDIEGYAKEITDYIPQGLKFVAEDNPNWKDEGNNIISTRLLENTLLKPGEHADVEVVLTWINGKDNVGLKVNTAEISEDYNDKGVPDIDSTPDNKVPGEDDIDDAPVMLSVETGREILYIGLGITALVTIAGGIFLIKKYVL